MTTTPRMRFLGAETFQTRSGESIVVTPRGRTFRVGLPAADLRRILTSFDGTRSLDEVVERLPETGEYRRFLDRMRTEGVLAESDPVAGERHLARFSFHGGAGSPRTVENVDLVLLGDPDLTRVAASHDAVAGFRTTTVVESVSGLSGTGDVVLAQLHGHHAAGPLGETEKFCARFGLRWSHFHLENGIAYFGPHVLPGTGAAFSDLDARRIAAAHDPELVRALDRPAGAGYLPPAAELSWLVGTFLMDLTRWLLGAGARGHGHEVEVDPVLLSVVAHPVLPLPHQRPDTAVTGDPSLLTDERTGLVTAVSKVRHHSAIPLSLATYRAQVADISRVSEWRNDVVAGGSAFGDEAAARNAALGEAVERYCGNIITRELLTHGSHRVLARGRDRVIDPASLVLFSDRQHATRGFPFTPFTSDLPVHWVRGRSLTTGEPSLLPASLVYPNWYRHAGSEVPRTNSTYYPGLATGTDLTSALTAGLLELVERHATMVWWLNLPPARRITGVDDSVFDGTELLHRSLDLPNEFGVPVVAGVVEDPSARLLTIGFAARPTVRAAALKAWTEGLTLQDLSRDLQEPDGGFRRAAAKGQVGDTIKPWRADRRYLDSYRADFRDVVDLTCQAQVHLDPVAQDLVRPWTDGPLAVAASDLPQLPGGGLAELRAVVEARGHEIFYADITTPDVAHCGLTVVRVVVPGLVPNFPAAFPYLGNGVVQQAAVDLGWRTTPLPEDGLNHVPLPHA